MADALNLYKPTGGNISTKVDKVEIDANGNFKYRDKATAHENYIGGFDVAYSLTSLAVNLTTDTAITGMSVAVEPGFVYELTGMLGFDDGGTGGATVAAKINLPSGATGQGAIGDDTIPTDFSAAFNQTVGSETSVAEIVKGLIDTSGMTAGSTGNVYLSASSNQNDSYMTTHSYIKLTKLKAKTS